MLHKRGNTVLDKLPVRLFEDFYYDLRNGRIKDLIDVLRDKRIEAVIHTAAHVPYTPDKDYEGVNVGGTAKLLTACNAACVSVFVFASSISVYSCPPAYLPVDEVHPTRSDGGYSASKITGEKMCMSSYGIEKHGIERVVIVRYSGVFGSGGAHRVISKFTQAALSGEPITVDGDGEQSGDFVYADDAAEGALLALKSGNGIYNIGSGQETKLVDLAKTIRELSGSQSEIVLSGATERPFRFYTDIGKANRELGYSPRDLRDRIKEYVDDAREVSLG